MIQKEEIHTAEEYTQGSDKPEMDTHKEEIHTGEKYTRARNTDNGVINTGEGYTQGSNTHRGEIHKPKRYTGKNTRQEYAQVRDTHKGGIYIGEEGYIGGEMRTKKRYTQESNIRERNTNK